MEKNKLKILIAMKEYRMEQAIKNKDEVRAKQLDNELVKLNRDLMKINLEVKKEKKNKIKN